MKRSTVVGSMICAVLLSTAAWAAPKPAPISEIKVGWDDGGRGGVHGGASEFWTVRANGTATHSVSITTFEAMEEGNTQTPETSGTFDKNDFARLAAHLRWSHVFDLKVSPSKELSNQTYISARRGGKWQTITIPDDTPSAAAASAAWVTLTLARSITAQTDWRNPAGFSINTGLDGRFSDTLKDPTTGQENYFNPPVCAVLDTTGKRVGTLEQTSPSGYFRVVLPPGADKLARTVPTDATPPPGYAWRAPATAQVQAGRFTSIVISLEKTPATP